MKRCFRVRWICPIVSENQHVIWRYLLLDFNKSICTPFSLHWHGGLFRVLPSPDSAAGFDLGGCICQKLWTAVDRLSIIWKLDLSNKIKRNFFQAVIVLILLYGCITGTLTQPKEKKIDGSCTRMLRAILNKSLKQHPTKQQLYGHRLPICQTIQIRRTKHAGHCWRSKDELINDVFLWALRTSRCWSTSKNKSTNLFGQEM